MGKKLRTLHQINARSEMQPKACTFARPRAERVQIIDLRSPRHAIFRESDNFRSWLNFLPSPSLLADFTRRVRRESRPTCTSTASPSLAWDPTRLSLREGRKEGISGWRNGFGKWRIDLSTDWGPSINDVSYKIFRIFDPLPLFSTKCMQSPLL